MQLLYKILMSWMLNLFLKINNNVCICWIATYYKPVINSRRHATKVYFSKETLNKKKKFRFCVCVGCCDRINNINVFDNCPNNWERENTLIEEKNIWKEPNFPHWKASKKNQYGLRETQENFLIHSFFKY